MIAHNRRLHEAIRYSHDEVLFKQFIEYLQKHGLKRSDLSIAYAYIIVKQFDKEYDSIVKLGAGLAEEQKLVKAMKEFDPEIVDKSGIFLAYDLALISYEARSEIPMFWYIYQHQKEVDHLRADLGYDSNYGSEGFMHSVYEDLMSGKMTEADLWRLRSVERPSLTVSTPYSDIWKQVDERHDLNGIMPLGCRGSKKLQLMTTLEDTEKKYKEKINVLVCQSWHSLFLEELAVLYNKANFCNNCGKPLPFQGYRGEYCPPAKENEACMKERARKRKKRFTS